MVTESSSAQLSVAAGYLVATPALGMSLPAQMSVVC